MRINVCDEEDRPGQFALWDANCRRSMRGQLGQQELRELEAALVALPEKRLIHGLLTDDEGGVCAIGCYAKHKGLDLSKFDPEYDSDEVGIKAGMPRLVAWKVVALNDVELDTIWESGRSRPMTPEERYERTLKWVREQIISAPPADDKEQKA